MIVGLLAVTFLLTQCKNNEANKANPTDNEATTDLSVKEGNKVTFSGKITGGGGLKAHFDRIVIDATESLKNVSIEGDGMINFDVEDVTPGMYRMRIGQKKLLFILDGTEDEVKIDANLNTIQNFEYSIEGSANTNEYKRIIRHFIENKPKEEDLANYIDTTSFPLVGLSIATEIFHPKRFQFTYLTPERIIDIHSRANKKLVDNYPGAEIISVHSDFVNQIKIALSQQTIRVGGVPPDIQLPSPKGKDYTLSALKGKVVLLDFWASWCRPCRFNNPELVRIYKKYKSQGFTVYSVSLDRNAQGWEQAIVKDGLEWEYHVSDLKYWQSGPANMCGVYSLPHTFLLDRKGKIAAINPRGPQLEEAVKKLL